MSNFSAGLSSINQAKQAKLRQQASSFELESEKNMLKQQFTTDWLYYQSLIKQRQLLNDSLSTSQKIQQSLSRQFIAASKQWQYVMSVISTISQLESQLSDIIAESMLASWRLAIRTKGINKI